MKPKPKYIYTCGNGWYWEIGECRDTVYASAEELKQHVGCWPSCGIVRLKVTVDKWLLPRSKKDVNLAQQILADNEREQCLIFGQLKEAQCLRVYHPTYKHGSWVRAKVKRSGRKWYAYYRGRAFTELKFAQDARECWTSHPFPKVIKRHDQIIRAMLRKSHDTRKRPKTSFHISTSVRRPQ